MTALFALLAVVGLLSTVSALVWWRHPAALNVAVFTASWLTSELAPWVLATQVLVTAGFVALGVLDDPLGVAALAVTLVSWAGLVVVMARAARTPEVFADAFEAELGTQPLELLPPARREELAALPARRWWANPFRFAEPAEEIVSGIAYAPGGRRQTLDVHRPRHHDGPRRAVVLQVHGGAWLIGAKEQQGRPLMARLAAAGHPSVAINYRLSPRFRFPAHLEDVKSAIAWIRANPDVHGGDPDRIVITGGSAGGHLSLLAALTADQPVFQPGFEDVDTSVIGCVPFYPPTDFLDRYGLRGRFASLEPLLRRAVMPADGEPDLWEAASPVAAVRPDACPMLVVQGAIDVLVYRTETRRFVEELRAVSDQPVVYAELPGAQHAFEVFHSTRCDAAVDAVVAFVAALDEGVLPAPRRVRADRGSTRADGGAGDVASRATGRDHRREGEEGR